MLRLPVSPFASALLAFLPLAVQAQMPTDSVVRTTTVTTITTTTVVKPASPDEKPGPPVTTSSTTSSTTTAPASATRQPGPGDLTGARPKAATAPATPRPAATATTSTKATVKAAPVSKAVPASRATTTTRPATAARSAAYSDPELTRMVQQDVDLSKVKAEQLSNLYERFMETTRAERRQWTTAQWESASAVLTRLNQRYEQVRADLSLEEKLNIRTLQGEFHGLKAAKQVSKSL